MTVSDESVVGNYTGDNSSSTITTKTVPSDGLFVIGRVAANSSNTGGEGVQVDVKESGSGRVIATGKATNSTGTLAETQVDQYAPGGSEIEVVEVDNNNGATVAFLVEIREVI